MWLPGSAGSLRQCGQGLLGKMRNCISVWGALGTVRYRCLSGRWLWVNSESQKNGLTWISCSEVLTDGACEWVGCASTVTAVEGEGQVDMATWRECIGWEVCLARSGGSPVIWALGRRELYHLVCLSVPLLLDIPSHNISSLTLFPRNKQKQPRSPGVLCFVSGKRLAINSSLSQVGGSCL